MGSHFSPIYTAGKKSPDQFFLTIYKGNNQVRFMIEKRNSTHGRNHRKARQAHMKMVRNEDEFTQCFRTAKGVQTSFFSVWGPQLPMVPKPEKASPDPFHENMVRKVYTAKISGPYQLFYGSGPIFFCSVNRALVSHTSRFQTILFAIIRKKEP